MTPTIVPALSMSPYVRACTSLPAAPTRSPLPVPPMPTRPVAGMVYAVAVMDCHGRLADRTIPRALGWNPGFGIALRAIAASILVEPDPHGTARISADGHVRLPVGLRRRYQLTAGDRILLAADPPGRRLLLHPAAALDALLTAHHAALLEGITP